MWAADFWANWEIRHGRLFTAATAPPAGITLGRWNGGYIRYFPLLPFGVPIAPTVLGVGGTHPPKFGVVVDI